MGLKTLGHAVETVIYLVLSHELAAGEYSRLLIFRVDDCYLAFSPTPLILALSAPLCAPSLPQE